MKKIFVLDDNVELIEIIQMILKSRYEIKTSLTANNIVHEVSQFQPDAILIDHFIGVTESGNVIDQLKNAIPDFSVPVILFSASHNLENRASEIGAAGYIEKPSSINYIRNYVNKILGD